MLRYRIYVNEYFRPGHRRESGEWHLFVLRDEPSAMPYFTLCRSYTFDFKSEFGDAPPMSLSQWQENAGAEFLCSACDDLASEAIAEWERRTR